MNWKKEKYLEAYELRYVDADAEKMEHNKKRKRINNLLGKFPKSIDMIENDMYELKKRKQRIANLQLKNN